MEDDGTIFSPSDPFALPPDDVQDDVDDWVEPPKWWYAAQLRIAGASWEEIARVLGYKSGHTAMQAANTRWRERKAKDALPDLVDLELERLDMLQLICMRTARHGDLNAVKMILAIMHMRMRLLGTEKKAESGQVTTNNTAIFIGGDEESYLTSLREARAMVTAKALNEREALGA